MLYVDIIYVYVFCFIVEELVDKLVLNCDENIVVFNVFFKWVFICLYFFLFDIFGLLKSEGCFNIMVFLFFVVIEVKGDKV